MKPKDHDNPFDSVTEHSKRTSYRYYKNKYPDITHDEIMRRVGVTRKEIEEKIRSVFDPPDGEIIHECPQYIYYTDKVWSKERWTILTMRYYPRLKKYKTFLRHKPKQTRLVYEIGTIPPNLQE